MSPETRKRSRYGLTIDLDLCDGCGACMVACAIENNVPAMPAGPRGRKGITWIRVYEVRRPRAARGRDEVVYVPVPCQHCDKETPCVLVCPQRAVERDPETGIVSQIPARCLGCRYCVAACPYHARYFNWWDPVWPEGMEACLNPSVSPRMRGVVEKCNLCHGRLQEARSRAAADGRERPDPGEYRTACDEGCPMGAIRSGDLDDPEEEVHRLAQDPRAFRLLPSLGTDPKIYYLTSRPWVRRLGESALRTAAGEVSNV